MGRTLALLTSLRMTIGMFVTGSIIRPRIFISSSIRLLHHRAGKAFSRSVDGLSCEGIGAAARDAHVQEFADELVRGLRAVVTEAEGAVARGAAGPEVEGFVASFDVDLFDGADEGGVGGGVGGAV